MSYMIHTCGEASIRLSGEAVPLYLGWGERRVAIRPARQ